MKAHGFKMMTKTIGGVFTKNSPTILTGLSVAGLIGTTIMGIKATPKALEILDEMVEIEQEPITKKDIVKATWKVYLPTALMGAATIGCIVGANSISLRRNAALASLYSLSETALREYQAKVVERIGEGKHREIREEIHKDKLKSNPVNSHDIIVTGRGDTLCYDSQSGRYFWSRAEYIESALAKLSQRLMSDMYISLNEVYSELGLEGTKLGDMVGWHIDHGIIIPEFSTQLSEDNRPCLVLDFENEPRYCDRNY